MEIKFFKKKGDQLPATSKKQSFKDRIVRLFSSYTFLFSFLILIVIETYFNPQFLSYDNISLLLLQSTIKGIIAAGMTLVIIAGMIDLSVGSMVALVGGLGVVACLI